MTYVHLYDAIRIGISEITPNVNFLAEQW